MWKVEVWIKPVKQGGMIVKPGRWRTVDPAEGFGQAKLSVLIHARKLGVAKATKLDAEPEEVRGMRAMSHGRSFSYWTGSGGLVG